jgi:hypothetical protein
MMLTKLSLWIMVSLLAATSVLGVPPGYNVIRDTGGGTLYQNGPHFVEVIRLDQGGEVRFQNGTKVGPGCFDDMNCEDLETFWGWMSGNADAFAVSNGQFFNNGHDPAGLAFTVKADDEMIHCGYGVNDPAECQNQIMVEIWETYARFSTFDRDWHTVEASSAPNVIVALREDCPKNPSGSIERTFIGSQDSNGDQKDETFFILNSTSCTQAQAANILRDFGASHVAMLDGGGSTQMICQGAGFIGSTRQIPQTLASIGSQHYRCVYHNQSNNPNWIWARPGQLIENVWVEFQDAGSETWAQSGGVGNQRCVELWACDDDGVFANSPAYPGSSWINRIRVKAIDQQSVAPQGIARFTFDIQIPMVPSQDLHAFFRPVHGGQRMYNWGGMSFPIHVDADAPQAPPNVSASPSSCVSSNSFTFTWSTPADPGGSGIDSYNWKVDEGGETSTTGTSVGPITAPNQGWNIFYVRARDRVGNWSGYSSVQFCWLPADGWNPSFETDADQNGIPDGWSLICVNGAEFERRSDGSPDGSSHTMRFVDNDADDWSAMGRHAGNTLLYSGVIYRISFWYRAWSNAPFGWQMSTPNLQSYINVLNCTVSNPLADAAWHHFWGAPFMLSGSDVTDYPYMTFKHGQNAIGTVDIDGVVIEQVPLCQ